MIFNKKLGPLFSWAILAVYAFIAVILLYQFTVAFVSFALGYQTKIHFGKVDSLPHYNIFWSDLRVVAVYVCPFLFLLFVAGVFFVRALFQAPSASLWSWFRFWFMFFCTILVSSLLSISAFAETVGVATTLFQGMAVVNHWFDASFFFAILFVAISIFSNVIFGFLQAPIFLNLAPLSSKRKRSRFDIVFKSFVLPIILLLGLTMIMVSPVYWSFFALIYIHTILWIPGLLIASQKQDLLNRGSGKDIFKIGLPSIVAMLLPVLIFLIRFLL